MSWKYREWIRFILAVTLFLMSGYIYYSYKEKVVYLFGSTLITIIIRQLLLVACGFVLSCKKRKEQVHPAQILLMIPLTLYLLWYCGISFPIPFVSNVIKHMVYYLDVVNAHSTLLLLLVLLLGWISFRADR